MMSSEFEKNLASDGSTTRLAMRGVRKRFGATQAIDGVELTVERGEVHGLVGENGAGKSTLMKVLAGALEPDAGQMWLDGELYAPQTPADGRAAGIAMIYQELSLAPHLSVMENILLGVEPKWGPFIGWHAMRERASRAIAEVGRPDLPVDAPVGALPVAERQLVEIARCMAIGCRVLVLDEPTSSLASRDVEHLFELIRRLRDRGLAIVYISHFLEEVQAVCDRFTVLRDGRTVGGGATRETTPTEIVSMMVGRQVDDLYPRSVRMPGEVLLRLDGVAGEVKPVSASLEVRRGEVVGIAGLLGAGRTELLRAVFGLDLVKSGEVKAVSYSGWHSPGERWRTGVGLVSEDRKQEGLAVNLSVAENLTLPRLRGCGPGRFVSPGGQDQASEPWLRMLGIKCATPRQAVTELSGGNQQKIALARLLHADVDLLLLDEPTRGIDVGSKAEIYRLIDGLAAGKASIGGRPRAVLIVSSYLPELMGVCDRIAVMYRGRLGPCMPVEELNEHRIMLAATGAN